MARPDKYAIVTAARQFVKLMREADEPALNAAYQYIANDANNSQYATDLEPLQNICGAFTAETKRRGYEWHQRAEGCVICDNEGSHNTRERPHVFAGQE